MYYFSLLKTNLEHVFVDSLGRRKKSINLLLQSGLTFPRRIFQNKDIIHFLTTLLKSYFTIIIVLMFKIKNIIFQTVPPL